MKIAIFVLFFILTIGGIVYVMRRDSKVDDGAEPLKVKVPFTNYVLTPSRWVWQRIRGNKEVVGVVIVAFFAWLFYVW